ncbi:transposase [Spirosoma jeollabukense]
MDTPQRAAGQRRIYTDAFKRNALLQLNSGRNLHMVAHELGIGATTLLRWKRQAEGEKAVGPTKERFDNEFRTRALKKLAKGQSLRQVASAMGVSVPSLVQWKRQATEIPSESNFLENAVNKGPHYTDNFHGVAHQVLDNGQPPGLVTSTSGVVGTTSPRWKNQADAQASLTTIDSPSPSYTDEDKAKALGLLISGKSITQVAVLLAIPTVLIRRWWILTRRTDPTESVVDGRRLYDDVFKDEALRQINRGVSVRKLAKEMGVSEVTLHKWRKQAAFITEPLSSDSHKHEFIGCKQPTLNIVKDDELMNERITQLEYQLRQVEAERDTLKKAIRILMCAS